jgi:hypothetical protein
MRDEAAAEYLAPTLAAVSAACGGVQDLEVLTVASDGSCLPHAVSRALVGVELFFDALRQDLSEELIEHAEWYEQRLNRDESGGQVVRDEETWREYWQGIVAAAAPTVGVCVGQERWLEQPHILGYVRCKTCTLHSDLV